MPRKAKKDESRTISIKPSWKGATWIAVNVLMNDKAGSDAHKKCWEHFDKMCEILTTLNNHYGDNIPLIDKKYWNKK